MVWTGVYAGNRNSDIDKHEDWLGQEVDVAVAFTGQRDVNDMNPQWMGTGDFLGTGDTGLLWSIPLVPNTHTLQQVAAGALDADFRKFAQTIEAQAPPAPDGNFYVRTGWEVGGEHFRWAKQAKDDPEAFKDAFARVADIFHGEDARFKMVWDAHGDRGDVIGKYYPGHEHVDVISQDVYWNPQWSSSDPVKAWDYYAGSSQGQGLREMEKFAQDNGKEFAVSEWGVPQGVDATKFIELFTDWAEDEDILWASYWDDNGGYPGKLSDGSDPASGAAYKAAVADSFG